MRWVTGHSCAASQIAIHGSGNIDSGVLFNCLFYLLIKCPIQLILLNYIYYFGRGQLMDSIPVWASAYRFPARDIAVVAEWIW